MLTLVTLTTVPRVVDTVNMPPTSGAPRPYHHGRLRESLVDAGFQLARANGPEAVVLRAVTRSAGVSHNAAYRHFSDHQELINAVAQRCMDQLADLMRKRTAEVRVRDPRRRARAELQAIGRAYIEFALTEPGWFRTAFAIRASPDPATEVAAVAEKASTPYELLNARLDRLVEVGELPADRRPGAELAAWSAVHGLSMLLVDGPLQDMPADERAHAIDTVLHVIERGL